MDTYEKSSDVSFSLKGEISLLLCVYLHQYCDNYGQEIKENY